MKPPTVFLGEMTNPEVEAFLREHDTVIVPTGSTEQHGPHGPLLTDVLVPNEVARRVAPRVGAVVAPPINYGLSYPHVGFTGVVHIRDPDLHGADRGPVRRRSPRSASGGSCSSTATTTTPTRSPTRARPRGNGCPTACSAFPINYWDGMTADEAAEFFGPTTGLHANRGETSAVLAINPDLVDLERANAEMPPFPEVTQPGAGPHRVLLLGARVGPPRDPLGHVGRRARVDGRSSASATSPWSPRRRSGCSTTSSGRSPPCRLAERERRQPSAVTRV